MSVRLRLTLLYTAILALTLAGLGGVLYGTQVSTLRSDETRLLAGWAQRIIDHIQSGAMTLDGPFGDRPLNMPQPPPEQGPPRRFGAPATYAQMIDLAGKPLLRSANLDQAVLPLTAAGLRAVGAGGTWVESAQLEGEWMLIYTAPVVSNGQVTGAVQVAHALATQDSYLGTLARNLLLASGVAIVAAFGCGWLMSGLVLRPIHRITYTARTIGADRDLSRRVEYRGPNDELGQLATTLNAMLAELESAHQQQQQFVADVSHELRTPLTTLNGNIELLRRQPPISSQDRAEVLADMAEESKRLIRLVSALLTLARADARQPLRREVIEARPAIADIARQASLLAPDRAFVVGDLPDEVLIGDPDALRQVLLILVDNALKYTDGPVEVSVRSVEDSLAITIADSGPGIDPAALPHVFERFYRSDAARDHAGFGLGLSIAKALVEAQGGSIRIESDVQRGSAVTVMLPSAVPPVPAAA